MFDDTGGYTCWAIHGIQTGVNDANVAIFHGVSTVVHGSSVKYELTGVDPPVVFIIVVS